MGTKTHIYIGQLASLIKRIKKDYPEIQVNLEEDIDKGYSICTLTLDNDSHEFSSYGDVKSRNTTNSPETKVVMASIYALKKCLAAFGFVCPKVILTSKRTNLFLHKY